MKKIIFIFTLILLFSPNLKADEIKITNPYPHRMHLYIYNDGIKMDYGIVAQGGFQSVSLAPKNKSLSVQYEWVYDKDCYEKDINDIQNIINKKENERIVREVLKDAFEQWFSETEWGKKVGEIKDILGWKDALTKIFKENDDDAFDSFLNKHFKDKIKSEIINSIDSKIGRIFTAGLIAYITAGEGYYNDEVKLMKQLTQYYYERLSKTGKIRDTYQLKKKNYVDIAANYHFGNNIRYMGDDSFISTGAINQKTTPVSFSVTPSFSLEADMLDIKLPLSIGQSLFYEHPQTLSSIEYEGLSFRYFQMGIGYRVNYSQFVKVGWEMGYHAVFKKEWKGSHNAEHELVYLSDKNFVKFADKLYLKGELIFDLKYANINFGCQWVPGLDEKNDNGEVIKYAKYNAWTLYAGISIPIVLSKMWMRK